VIGGCLDFVHRKNIIHRDIKPANILFHSDGTPILTDFGVAKQQSTDSRLTKDGTALGSPYYISPEQAENRQVDGRADIYSLGIILYEMLTGKKPFEGESDIQIIISHLSDPIPSLPPELERYQELLDRMIAKNPDERFSSAADMLEYISAFRQGGCRPRPKSISAGIKDTGYAYDTSLLGNTFRWILGHHQESGGMRIAVAMSVLLLIALVSLKATPVIMAKAQHLFAASDQEMTAQAPVVQSRDASPAGHPGYLVQARQALRKLRYTKPEKDNAYYYYRMALKEAPGNEEALQGIARIAEIQADLVEWAVGLHEYSKAKEYLETGLKIDPHNRRLLELAENGRLR